MNRVGIGLALGAGYVLGRTKKLKVAVAVGTAVAGKRLNLTPRGIADLVSTQLRNNPQFLEIGDQLRQDLRGVGKAATGALVERQINGLADRLHGRTSQVRDQLSGVTSRAPGTDLDEGADDEYDDEPERNDERNDERDDARHDERDDERHDERDDARDDGPARRGGRTARKAADEAAPDTARKAPASAKKAAAKKAAARKTPEKQAPARKTAAKRTQSATKSARGAARGTRARLPKKGGE